MRSIKVWWLYTINSFQWAVINRGAAVVLILGKILRIFLFALFLLFLFQGTKSIAGYTRDQIIFFYLSFNLIDTLAQFLFREVYRFRDLVVRGDLDLILIKPINPLIRVLLGGADILDLFILILIAIILFLFGINNITTNLFHWFLYLLLIANGLIIAAAFHIFVLGFGITTTSIDHLVLFYRDMSSMLRIPVDLYTQPIRLILTFLIPLGLMITLPAKALMNLVSPDFVIVSFLIGSCLFWLSLKYWNFCLKQYTSASS